MTENLVPLSVAIDLHYLCRRLFQVRGNKLRTCHSISKFLAFTIHKIGEHTNSIGNWNNIPRRIFW
ncbi:hypothetical protein D0T25_03965 [Duganella sp. BJB488]|nr:hypothetical protein D0T25_03965 [Duganella sp. BJB488]